MDFTFLDIGLAIIFAIFLIRGLLCGLIQELAGLVGIVLGFYAAMRFQNLLTPHVSQFVDSQGGAEAISYIVIFLVVFFVVILVGMLIRKLMKVTLTAWVDYLTGSIIGAAKGIIVCTIIYLVLQAVMPQMSFIKDSFLAPYLNQIAEVLKPYLPSFP